MEIALTARVFSGPRRRGEKGGAVRFRGDSFFQKNESGAEPCGSAPDSLYDKGENDEHFR